MAFLNTYLETSTSQVNVETYSKRYSPMVTHGIQSRDGTIYVEIKGIVWSPYSKQGKTNFNDFERGGPGKKIVVGKPKVVILFFEKRWDLIKLSMIDLVSQWRRKCRNCFETLCTFLPCYSDHLSLFLRVFFMESMFIHRDLQNSATYRRCIHSCH